VRCEVAVEVTTHLRGIAAKAGEEIELFLQLGLGADSAGKLAHFVKVLLILDDHRWVGFPFATGWPNASPARGVSGREAG
jgi:hypothetical protein